MKAQLISQRTRMATVAKTSYNRFDNRLDVCLHDAADGSTGCRLYNDGSTTGCSTGWTTGWTTGCSTGWTTGCIA